MAFRFLGKAANVLRREKVLYFPGCLTSLKHPKFVQNYRSMLNDAGVDYVMVDELKCCGLPLLYNGFVDEFRELKKENEEILQRYGITRIISNCSRCFRCFSRHYGLQAEHISRILDEKKYSGPRESGEVEYHESCILLEEEATAEPRNLLRRKGFRVKERKHVPCGVGGGLVQNKPALANKLAEKALKGMGGEIVVTSCPYCYTHLKENNKDKVKKAFELSEVLFDE